MPNDFNDTLVHILKEMCTRVGADYESIDFKKQDWFREYTWNVEDQDNFKEWIVDYVFKHSKARREFLSASIRDKEHIRKAADFFIFNYGWSLPAGIYE